MIGKTDGTIYTVLSAGCRLDKMDDGNVMVVVTLDSAAGPRDYAWPEGEFEDFVKYLQNVEAELETIRTVS